MFLGSTTGIFLGCDSIEINLVRFIVQLKFVWNQVINRWDVVDVVVVSVFVVFVVVVVVVVDPKNLLLKLG